MRRTPMNTNSIRSLWQVIFLTLMVIMLGVGEVCAETTIWVSMQH